MKFRLISVLLLILVSAVACTAPAVEIEPEEVKPYSHSTYIMVHEYLAAQTGRQEIYDAFDLRVQSNTPLEAGKLDPNGVIEIAVVYPGNQVSDYWRRSVQSFQKRMDEIGLSYNITETFTDASGELQLQEDAIRQAILSKPDYLIFTLDVTAHKKLIESAIIAKETKIILQNITTPLQEWVDRQPFLYVGFDHMLGTQVLADHIVDQVGGSGQYAVLYFTDGYVSEMRGDTFIEAMEAQEGMQLVGSFFTDGNREKAKAATLTLLADNPDLKVIYSCSTDITFGILDALKETGKLGDIMVNGWGGGSAELEAIAAGEIDVTVMRMNDDNGIAMAEAIYLDQTGLSGQVPTVYSGAFKLITKETPEDRIDQYKERAFRYSED